jgi:hypothetical protein
MENKSRQEIPLFMAISSKKAFWPFTNYITYSIITLIKFKEAQNGQRS